MSWIEVIAFAVILGLGSSAHCIGMCGVFAASAASTRGSRSFGFYILGKASTYMFIGSLAGTLGSRALADSTNLQAWAGVFAAVTLIIVGVLALLPGKIVAPWSKHIVRALAPIFALARSGQGLTGRFLLGITTGFLPCGIVYVAALQAVLAGSVLKSVALMGILGIATAPSLIVAGLLSRKLGATIRPVAYKFAGGILMAGVGVWTAWRSIATMLEDAGAPTCCH